MTKLRTIRPVEDAAAVFEVFRDGDEDLRRQAPQIETLRDARDYLETLAADAWAITASGILIGIISASGRSTKHRSAWMSYWLAPSARGAGIATRALATVSEELFEQGFHRLELGARTNNPASVKTAERAGYVHEGVSREELEYERVRFDTVRMALLVSDPRPTIEHIPFDS